MAANCPGAASALRADARADMGYICRGCNGGVHSSNGDDRSPESEHDPGDGRISLNCQLEDN